MLLQSALVITHTAWLDEWQALQIAAQSPSLHDLLENLRYEGHPPLWYLLLRGAHVVLPTDWTLPGLLLPIALATQSLILFRSPFRRIERLLLSTSAFVLFEWCTIARDLALGVLLTLCVVAARNRRFYWAAIALLPMEGVQFGFLSIAFVLLSAVDHRWSWWGVALWMASAVLAALTVIPAPDAFPAQTLLPYPYNWLQPILRLSILLVPLQTINGHVSWNGILPSIFLLPASIFFLIFSLWEAARQRRHIAVYGSILIITLLFSSLVYPLAPRHLSLLVLLLIVLKWREADAGLPLRPAANIWLTLASACGLLVATLNLVIPFDTAPAAARTIETMRLEQAHWVSWPQSHGQGIAALLGREFDSLEKHCTQSFIRWNIPDYVNPGTDLQLRLLDTANKFGHFYLLTDRMITFQNPTMKPIAIIPPGFDQMSYYLYEIAPGIHARGGLPTRCAPARRSL